MLLYAGYIGGSADDYGYGIAVDGAGNAYATGTTLSDQASFPVSVGPDLSHNGGLDAFVAKIGDRAGAAIPVLLPPPLLAALIALLRLGAAWAHRGRRLG